MSQHGAVAWDSSLSKWLPTTPGEISPDGRTYVPEDTSNIQIADARTGAVLRTIAAGDYNIVVGITSAAIYATHGGIRAIPGLWRIDASTGVVTQVQASAELVEWGIVDGNTMWGTHRNGDGTTTIERIDLSTGIITHVLQPLGQAFVWLLGFVGTSVFVTLDPDLYTAGVGDIYSAMVVNPDGSVRDVVVPEAIQGKPPRQALQDGRTIFLSGLDAGLAAYDPDHGLQVLTDGPQNLSFLGPCKRQ